MQAYNILITARTFGTTNKAALAMLESAGFKCTRVDAQSSPEAFLDEAKKSDALILGTNPLDCDLLQKCPRLKIIAKHGSGVNNIDLDAARQLGITVTNVPAVNANTIADLTFAHIMATSGGIVLANLRARQGRHFAGKEVYGKTLGLVGFGAVAQAVAMRSSGFAMNVLAHDPFGETIPEKFSFVAETTLDNLLENSDIISVHAPLTPLTEDLLDAQAFSKMKKDAVLVNLGRSGVINESALYAHMKGGNLFGASLEAAEEASPLAELENITLSPPLGGFATETISAVSQACALNVLRKLQGHEPDFVVV